MDKIKRAEHFAQLEKDILTGKYADLDYQKAELIVPANKSDKDTNKNKKTEKEAFVPDIHFQSMDSLQAASDIIMTHRSNSSVPILPVVPTILVFGSAKNPGGGVAHGSKAQEEDIALKSTWYFQVSQVEGFYLEKHASAMNTDNLLYVKKGYVLKDDYGYDIDPYEVSFIGATAPNLNGLQKQNLRFNHHNEKEVYEVMAQRIEHVLSLAQARNRTHLVLGAWGCGVFGLDAQKVALIFYQKLSQGLYSGEVTFAIPDKALLQLFQNEFKQWDNEPVHTLKNKR